jgi:hypothetical protein
MLRKLAGRVASASGRGGGSEGLSIREADCLLGDDEEDLDSTTNTNTNANDNANANATANANTGTGTNSGTNTANGCGDREELGEADAAITVMDLFHQYPRADQPAVRGISFSAGEPSYVAFQSSKAHWCDWSMLAYKCYRDKSIHACVQSYHDKSIICHERVW